MLCQLCEVNEASVTIIPTGQGEPQSVCSPCMARMGLELAKVQLDGAEIAQILGPMFVQSPSNDELANENPPAKPRTRKGRKAAAGLVDLDAAPHTEPKVAEAE